MAIIFEQSKKSVNWVKILFVVFVVGFLIFVAYYLFFAPSPKLDIVLPDPLQRASQISNIDFVDPGQVLNHQNFKRLQNFVAPPLISNLGRSNPFVSF